ncbi:MAG: DNA polymerase/3'-5' exonuclease PolX [Acidimicrobiia bacterium]
MIRTNREVVRLLREYAKLLQLEEGSAQSFRVRAYDRAIAAVDDLDRDVATMSRSDLEKIEGVGPASARKIREYVDEGAISGLDRLRAKYPAPLVELTRIPGMGPKTVLQVRAALGVENVDDLLAAIASERLRELPGMGARKEEKIGRAIERLGLHGKERRTPIIVAMAVATEVVDALAALPETVHVGYCGSLRRFRDTVADVDIVAASKSPGPVIDAFVASPDVAEVIGSGDTKASVLTTRGFQLDLRVVAPSEYGAATLYFTGSKAHNIQLRQRAMDKGWMLNEYALSDAETGGVVASRTERAVYKALGLSYVPPEIREGSGEVDAAASGDLPRLVEERHIKGDLHVHSSWSGDGRSTLEEMVAAAAHRGLEYVAFTEHAEDLAVNGLSRSEVREEGERIAALREEYPDLILLHGAELNIGRDGGLDYDDDFLMEFDWCVASVHSHFDLDEVEQTERVLRAIAHPAVNVIGHLTGRRLGRRPGIDLDVGAVFAAAAATGTAIEINSHLDRLDAPAELIRRGRDVPDLRFVISTDAHHVSELDSMTWGVSNARRGWLERAAVANTWPAARFLTWAGAKRRQA